MIAVTGATGFVGRHTVAIAEARSLKIRKLIRNCIPSTANGMSIGELSLGVIDPAVFIGCKTVIHIAARAHRLGEHGPSALVEYQKTNVLGTQAVISAMLSAGVRRLVFVSSIKALGERSIGSPLRPNDIRHPEDPYGQSKSEAEDVITNCVATDAIDATIIRPVLVHGPQAQGNLRRLMEAIYRGHRLPLGAVCNRRSMIGLENLADALLVAATSPTFANARAPIYHLADDGVISTRRLVEILAEGMGVKPRLISVPRWLAVGGATLLGKGAMARRLFDDLEVDDSDFRRDYGWKPTIGLEDGLRLMAEDYARRMRDGSGYSG